MKKRASGILLPVFSLPSEYGIGDFGSSSYNFIDYLVSAGQTVWQILPLAITGYGNSPYSSVCSFSISPYYISPELLYKDGLITKTELNGAKKGGKLIDYGFLYSKRYDILKKAFSRFDKTDKDFVKFVKGKNFLDYALFTTLKIHLNFAPLISWEDKYKFRDKRALDKFYKENEQEVLFYEFTQFIAKKQWIALKKYANSKGVKILGDIPLYVALDSVDVWTNPKLFKLNPDLTPKKVAGVPPDYFSEDGQLWGNPVYDYEYHEKTGFSWWINRIKSALCDYDLIRIDHFRGLDRYFEIDADAKTAREGEWINVPSLALFTALHKKVNKNKIIAEDLGVIDDSVRKLLSIVGYPGMKILSFAFNGDNNNPYLPQNIPENAVCFTGTHDNDTLLGLIKSFNIKEKRAFKSHVKKSLDLMGLDTKISCDKELLDAVINLGYKSKAKLFIIPMQDVLGLNSSYRINVPGEVRAQNWAVRLSKKHFTENSIKYIKSLTKKYKR